MDGSNSLAGMIPQGTSVAMIGAGGLPNHTNPAQGAMGTPDGGAGLSTGASGNIGNGNLNLLSNLNSLESGGIAGTNNMAGTNSMNVAGMGDVGGGGLNPNDLNLALLMNLQQQGGGMGGGMNNPLVLQSMMGQGMPQMGAGMGVNNLLQHGMMNPSMAGMGGMGVPSLNGMGCMDGSGMGCSTNGNASAPGVNNNTPAPANKDPATNNDNDLLAQLIQNPMAAQMMTQGLNPMMLLGGMNGGMGQNQLGGSLGALGLGMNGLASSFPPGLGNSMTGPSGADASSGGFNLNMMSNLSSGGKKGATAPHPTALFAFGNPVVAAATLPQAPISKQVVDGDLKRPAPSIKPKKSGKKAKVPGKPKRPLSAYNFFFREERARILDSLPRKGGKKKKRKGSGGADKEGAETEVKEGGASLDHDEGDSGDYPLAGTGNKDYDRVGEDGKKIPHGKIGFENLAKLIGKRWQELDADGIEKYRRLADEDMTRYKREMDMFLTREAQEGAPRTGEGADGDLTWTKRKKTDGEGPKKKRVKKEGKVTELEL